MKLFSRTRRDGRPALTPLPRVPAPGLSTEWRARAAAAMPAPLLAEVSGPPEPVSTFRACSDGHETVRWYGLPGCRYCGPEAGVKPETAAKKYEPVWAQR